MRAVVSGQAGVALLWDGNRLSSLHAGVDGPPVPRRPREIPLLLGAANDLEFLDRIERPQVAQKLARASDEADALHLTLILLDGTLPFEIRREASLELEELLAGPGIRESLEKTFYARPLPVEADLAGALVHRAGPTSQVESFLRSLGSLQMIISEIVWAWQEIPDDVFGSPKERAEAQAAAVRGGLFRDLVRARAEAGEGDAFWMNGLLHPPVQGFKNQRAILQAWLSPFREEQRARPSWPETSFGWAEEVAETPEEETGSRRIRVDRRRAFERANRQKIAIVGAMQRRDFGRVDQFVEDLIAAHLETGGDEYASKSLCDLAMKAKALGFDQLHLSLSARSTAVKPDDGWAWAQYADALLRNAQPLEAMKAFERALAFGQTQVARTGQAEVLRAMGRLPEALAAHEATVAQFPENAVARNGRAEILRAMNRFPEALAAYEATVAQFPGNVVARAGQAELLRAMSRFPEALAAYEATVAQFPQDVMARIGQAEVLRAMGRFPEALAAYEATVAQFPGNVVARAGQAEVLQAMSRFPEALAAYEATVAQFPQDVVARTGQAEVLRAMGRLPEALAVYEATMAQFPQDVVARTGLAEVLRAMGRLPEALAAYEVAVAQFPQDVVARTGQAEVLRALSRLPEALAAYEATMAISLTMWWRAPAWRRFCGR